MEINVGNNIEFAGIKPPYIVEVDPTLTKAGQAADARVTGSIAESIGSEYVPKTWLAGQEMVSLTVNGYSGETLTNSQHIGNGTLELSIANPEGQINPKIDILAYKQYVGPSVVSVEGDHFVFNDENVATQNWVNSSARTYKSIPNSWTTHSTTEALCQSIVNDQTATAGMVYLGIIGCDDIRPLGLVQAEAVIEIISEGSNGKDIHITLTSVEVAPYHWEYNYAWVNGSYINSGWNACASAGVGIKYIRLEYISGEDVYYLYEGSSQTRLEWDDLIRFINAGLYIIAYTDGGGEIEYYPMVYSMDGDSIDFQKTQLSGDYLYTTIFVVAYGDDYATIENYSFNEYNSIEIPKRLQNLVFEKVPNKQTYQIKWESDPNSEILTFGRLAYFINQGYDLRVKLVDSYFRLTRFAGYDSISFGFFDTDGSSNAIIQSMYLEYDTDSSKEFELRTYQI